MQKSLSSFYILWIRKGEEIMSHKLTICITETLERLIEVEVDDIDCDPIEYIRQQYLDEEIILDSSDLVDTEFRICE